MAKHTRVFKVAPYMVKLHRVTHSTSVKKKINHAHMKRGHRCITNKRDRPPSVFESVRAPRCETSDWCLAVARVTEIARERSQSSAGATNGRPVPSLLGPPPPVRRRARSEDLSLPAGTAHVRVPRLHPGDLTPLLYTRVDRSWCGRALGSRAMRSGAARWKWGG